MPRTSSSGSYSAAATCPADPDDAIGLVSFAGYADTAAPLTLDHENLVAVARNLEITTLREENFTAIGDALGLAVERLRESPAQSRIAVLLTDGVNNAGIETPDRRRGTGAFAGRQGVHASAPAAPASRTCAFRTCGAVPRLQAVRRRDRRRDPAGDVAERTGGLYYRANNAEALTQVYKPRSTAWSAPGSPKTARASTRSSTPCRCFAALLLAALGWLQSRRRCSPRVP